MPRIKLVEQEKYEFECQLNVRIADINFANHLDNSKIVAFLHEARIQTLKAINLNEANLGDNKTSSIIGDLAVNFKSEAFYGDTLIVETHIGEIQEKGFRLFHKISRDNVTIAIAEVGIAAFDYSIRKIGKVPDKFIDAVNNYI